MKYISTMWVGLCISLLYFFIIVNIYTTVIPHCITSTVELVQSNTWVFQHDVTSDKNYGPKVFPLLTKTRVFQHPVQSDTIPGPLVCWIKQIPLYILNLQAQKISTVTFLHLWTFQLIFHLNTIYMYYEPCFVVTFKFIIWLLFS